MQLDAYALTVKGRRANNEDAVCSVPELGLFAVADGMGGYEGGEVASALAIQTVHELVRRTAADHDVTWPYAIDPSRTVPENEIMVATRLAADRIMSHRTGALGQMGTTLALLFAVENTAVIAHVGDSRVYRLRAGLVTQLTVDHSLLSQMLAAGMTPDANFAFRHVITRALGTAESTADITVAPLEPGDVFLLCTDGLYEPLSLVTMAALLSEPPAQAARHLVDAAYAAGSRDNISAVVVRVPSRMLPTSTST